MSGVKATGNSTIILDGATISGNGGNGIEAVDSTVSINGAIISGNEKSGVIADSSVISARKAVIDNNGVSGIYNELKLNEDQVSTDDLSKLIEIALKEKKRGKTYKEVERKIWVVAPTILGLLALEPLSAAITSLASISISTLSIWLEKLS